jgi:hypothetical protein
MSSLRPAAAKAKSGARPGAKRASRAAARPSQEHPAGGDISGEAKRLAAEIERCIGNGRIEALTPEALQALMAALCRTYSACIENGDKFLPLASRTAVSPTDVMHTASGLLRGADLQVFELGMWQSWTGR